MHEISYWREDFPVALAPRESVLPERVDVAIIGGGLTGLATGLYLAQRSVSVAILEQEIIGWGASTRNAGMALTGLKLPPEQLVRRYGRAQARQFHRASLEALAFAEQLIQHENISCDFRRCGELCAAYRPSHFKALQASQKFLREEFDHPTELVPPADMPREVGSHFYHGGLRDAMGASLHPAKLVAGLAQAAQRAGVKIFEKTRVESCQRLTSNHALHTSRGHLQAQEIVAATNGYTPAMLPALRRRVIPVGSYIIVTEPLGAALAQELIPQNRMIFDSKNFLFYFRRTPDDRLLFGGRTSFTPVTTAQAAALLADDMRTVFPQLQQTKIAYAWRGNVAFTFDQMPHIGRLEGIHYAMGYCGHGVIMSLYLGHCLTRLLCGEACDTPFAQLAFPAYFFYREQPWFLPLAGAYFKMVDRFF